MPDSNRNRLTRAVALGASAAFAAAAPALAAGFSGATVSKQTGKVSGSSASIKVGCPSSAQGKCKGTLSLTTAKSVKGKRLKLGSASFSIPAGKTAAVKVKLNRNGQKALAGHKATPIATVASRDDSGTQVTHSSKITLKKGGGSGGGGHNPAPSPLY